MTEHNRRGLPSPGPSTTTRSCATLGASAGGTVARSGGRADRVARRTLLRALDRGTGGALELTEAEGTRVLGHGEPVARVTVHDPRTYGALLRSGSVGLGRTYVAGWWDADDLTAVVRLLSRHRRGTDTTSTAWAGPSARSSTWAARLRTPGRQRRQGQHRRPLRPLQRLVRPDAGRDHDLLVRRLRDSR